MAPWIQESEAPLMDGQEDLPAGLFDATKDEAEDDGGDETDENSPIDEEEEGAGLSPTDDNDASGSGSGSGGGNIGGYGNEHNYQSASSHDYPRDEIPVDQLMQGSNVRQSSTPPRRLGGRGRSTSGQTRMHYNQPSEDSSSSHNDMVDRFGNLSHNESSSHTSQSNQPAHYGYNPSWMSLPLDRDATYPYEQVHSQESQWWNLGHGWQHGIEENNSGTNDVNSPPPPPDPPRHSFWW